MDVETNHLGKSHQSIFNNQHKNARREKLQLTKLLSKSLVGDQLKEGTCNFMCHPEEARTREMERDFSEHFESVKGRKTEMDYEKAVKKFVRPNVGYEDEDFIPMDRVRPINILLDTMEHLNDYVLDSSENFVDIYNFYDDRARAICGDITMQSCKHSLAALSIHERMLRFYILSYYLLCDTVEDSVKHLMNKQLSDRLRSCIEIYNTCRYTGISCPFEPEIQSYILLMEFEDRFECTFRLMSLTDRVRESDEVKFVLKVIDAYTNQQYDDFFKLFKEASILHACLMNKLLNKARFQALVMLTRKHKESYPLDYLKNFLLFSSDEELLNFLASRNLVFKDGLIKKDDTIDADKFVSNINHIIERKRSGVKISDIIENNNSYVYNHWNKHSYFTNPPAPNYKPEQDIKRQEPLISFPTKKVLPEPTKEKVAPQKQNFGLQFNESFSVKSTPKATVPKVPLTSFPVSSFEMKKAPEKKVENKEIEEVKVKIEIPRAKTPEPIKEEKKETPKKEIKPKEIVKPKPKKPMDNESKEFIDDLFWTLSVKSSVFPLFDKWRRYTAKQIAKRRMLEENSFLPPGRILDNKFVHQVDILLQFQPKVETVQKPYLLTDSDLDLNMLLLKEVFRKQTISPKFWKCLISTHDDIRNQSLGEIEKWLVLSFLKNEIWHDPHPCPKIYSYIKQEDNSEKELYLCYRYCTMEYLQNAYNHKVNQKTERSHYVDPDLALSSSQSIIFVLQEMNQEKYETEESYWEQQRLRFKYLLDLINGQTHTSILILSFLSYFDYLPIEKIKSLISDSLELEKYRDFKVIIGIISDNFRISTLSFETYIPLLVELSPRQPLMHFCKLKDLIEYHGCKILNATQCSASLLMSKTSPPPDVFLAQLRARLSEIKQEFSYICSYNITRYWPAIEFTPNYFPDESLNDILPLKWNNIQNIRKINQLFTNELKIGEYHLIPDDECSIDRFLQNINKDYHLELFIDKLREQIREIFKLNEEERKKWLPLCFRLLNMNILSKILSFVPRTLIIPQFKYELIDFHDVVRDFRYQEMYTIPFDIASIYHESDEESSETVESEEFVW